jgi:hypothetical protein
MDVSKPNIVTHDMIGDKAINVKGRSNATCPYFTAIGNERYKLISAELGNTS